MAPVPAPDQWPAWATETVLLAEPDAGWALRAAAERRRLLDLRPWRRFLVKVAAGHRVAHLHLLDPGTPRWAGQLWFRDRLRACPGLAAEYAELKRRLAREFADDRDAYTKGKAAFVRRVLAERD
jgi:GrpB-like predicted nucleotidyltransferase (UPF0157 family)